MAHLTNYISIKGDKLVVTLRFNPQIVATIRTIDGRVWNAKDKQWEFPLENVKEVLDTLIPLGFVAHLDVMHLRDKEKQFLEEIDAIKAAPDIPYTGNLPLHDFQRKGVSFLKAMPSALLADVPGLGKTIQTIGATENDPQILVFVPASLKFSWEEEIKKWRPDAKIVVVSGDKKERAEQWNFGMKGYYSAGKKVAVQYVIANYELLIHDFDVIKDHDWHTIVCDEATRISNPDAQSVKNLKLLKSKKRIALTGTPISNKPDDIFSIMDWMVPRYLGTYNQFKAKYCELEEEWGRGRAYTRIIGYKNMDQLRDKVGRFMLRRTKEEVFDDFPKKTIENVVFSLPASERQMYDAIKEQVIEEIRQLGDLDTRTLGIVPVKMLRLKQCTDHTKLVDATTGESTKLETLKELLKPVIESGDKAIIFTQFAEMVHILMEELRMYNPMAIYGGVKEITRFERVQEFNHDPDRRVIIMTEAGAYGLNMQSASYVIHYDAPWSIAKLMQREDRAHRIGQKKAVTVYNLIAKNTIDEYVMKVLYKKQQVSVDILKDAERLAAMELDEDDIKAILRL